MVEARWGRLAAAGWVPVVSLSWGFPAWDTTFRADTESAFPRTVSGWGMVFNVSACDESSHIIPASVAEAMGRRAHRAMAKASILVFKMYFLKQTAKVRNSVEKALLCGANYGFLEMPSL